LVVTNAVYFKGQWTRAFTKQNTTEQAFHLLDNAGSVPVQMMHDESLQTGYASFTDYSLVSLPYKGNDVVMLVLLPHDGSTATLQKVLATEGYSSILVRWFINRVVSGGVGEPQQDWPQLSCT
jgi:serpin B